MDPKQFRDIIKKALVPVIKTQQEHSKKLGSVSKNVNVLTDRVDIVTGKVETLTKSVGTLTEKVETVTDRVNILTSRVDLIDGKVDTLTERADSITAELHAVHELASATLDVVKGRYEKNKRAYFLAMLENKTEIDEIKDHLQLPKEPYFGE